MAAATLEGGLTHLVIHPRPLPLTPTTALVPYPWRAPTPQPALCSGRTRVINSRHLSHRFKLTLFALCNFYFFPLK